MGRKCKQYFSNHFKLLFIHFNARRCKLIQNIYMYREPLDLPAGTADLLGRLFPFYFPVWELDHS